MLDEREKLFVQYWESHRDKEGDLWYQLLTGLPIGLIFSLPVLFIVFTARYWFKRADMVANSQMSMGILILAIVMISIFVALIYKRHQWEMKEQQYKELKAREQSTDRT